MLDFLLRLAVDFWATVGAMSPYLLFGFFVAGLLSVFVSQKMVERHLGGRGFLPVLKATLFGIPLPLCSCGVIPVAMSLRKHGASRGSTISFLLSTPQTGVDSIFVTYSLLGPVFALFRPLAALITGLVGGVLVNLFGQGPEDGRPRTEDGSLAMADGGHRQGTGGSAAPNPQSAIRNPKLAGPQSEIQNLKSKMANPIDRLLRRLIENGSDPRNRRPSGSELTWQTRNMWRLSNRVQKFSPPSDWMTTF